jgi:hypothetical protein
VYETTLLRRSYREGGKVKTVKSGLQLRLLSGRDTRSLPAEGRIQAASSARRGLFLGLGRRGLRATPSRTARLPEGIAHRSMERWLRAAYMCDIAKCRRESHDRHSAAEYVALTLISAMVGSCRNEMS